MEKITVSGISLEVPQEFCEDPSLLYEIISPDTWNNIFSDKNREMLMHFLPDFPEDDLAEKTRTLEMFFMHENFFFNNPLQHFFTKLSAGHFNPSVAKMKKIHRKLLQKGYKFRQKEYYHQMLEEVLIRRKYHLDRTRFQKLNNQKIPIRPDPPKEYDHLVKRVKKRYFKELSLVRAAADYSGDVSSDENYPEGPGFSLNKKQKRQLLLLDSSFEPSLYQVRGTHSLGALSTDLEIGLTTSKNPFEHSDEYFKTLLASHLEKKRRNKKDDLTLDTRGITLQSIMECSPLPMKKSFQRSHSASSTISHSLKNSLSSHYLKSKKKKIKTNLYLSHELPKRRSYSHEIEASSNSSSSESEMGISECAKPEKKKSVKPLSQNKFLDSHESPALKLMHRDIKEEPDFIKEDPDLPTHIMPSIDIKTECDPDSSEVKQEPSEYPMTGSIAAELTQETHISYFSLLRDVICSTNSQRMNRDQLESSVRAWQESAISPLNEWYSMCPSWVPVLSSAINFLCGNSSGGESISSDFVPYIEFKSSLKMYQWIGAGRDSDSNLESLCHFWFVNRDTFSSDWRCGDAIGLELDDSQSLPPPRIHTNWSVKPASDADKEVYHHQEKQRYDQPHKAFTFRTHGYESIIGPVKGIYTEQIGTMSKARGHSLLTSDRPPYVTILSLVRDAVSRLPNGEGTKTDICELLKESQFIRPPIGTKAENALSSVASGALDRLQFGDDPCVKFDTTRKLWVYLHRNRTEKEFERLHHIYGPAGNHKPRPGSAKKISKIKKEDASDTPAPPNVALEQFAPAIKQMDGSEVKVKAEDLLENWVTVSKNKVVKRNPAIRSSTFVQTSPSAIQKTKHKSTKSEVQQHGVHPVTVANSHNGMLCILKASSLPQTSVQSDLQSKQENAAVVLNPEEEDKLTTLVSTSNLTSVQPEATSIDSSTTMVCSMASALKVNDKTMEKKSMHGPPMTTGATVIATPVSADLQGVRDHQQVRGFKVLHYPALQSVPGKGVVGNASVVVDSNASLQTLVGQKLLLSGNRVLVQGGKVLHTAASAAGATLGSAASLVSGNITAKQLLTSVVPAQQIMALSTSRAQSNDKAQPEGRFIQIATLEGAGEAGGTLKKVAFLPQLAQCRAINPNQKAVDIQTSNSASVTKGATTIPLSDLKLKVGGAPATFVSSATNVLSLGGKQIILTPKAAASYVHPQIQQVVVSEGGSSLPSGESGLKTTASAGPQIVLPASALQGSGINLKRLQTFHSFKVVPASQIPLHQKGKPLVAHILTTPVTQVAPSPPTKNAATITTKPPDDQIT